MTDAPHDLTMAGHAKMLARSADALATQFAGMDAPWISPRESGHELASLVAQLADVVADLATSLQARIDREDDLRRIADALERAHPKPGIYIPPRRPCSATMAGHRCTRREHADDRHVWAMSDEEAQRILRAGQDAATIEAENGANYE